MVPDPHPQTTMHRLTSSKKPGTWLHLHMTVLRHNDMFFSTEHQMFGKLGVCACESISRCSGVWQLSGEDRHMDGKEQTPFCAYFTVLTLLCLLYSEQAPFKCDLYRFPTLPQQSIITSAIQYKCFITRRYFCLYTISLLCWPIFIFQQMELFIYYSTICPKGFTFRVSCVSSSLQLENLTCCSSF